VLVWAVLVVATVTTWSLSTDSSDPRAGRPLIVASIMVITFVKVWLVGAYFMELRGAPAALRRSFGAWCVLVGAGLVGFAIAG